jgi:hypothetical protein
MASESHSLAIKSHKDISAFSGSDTVLIENLTSESVGTWLLGMIYKQERRCN